jgi:hypothetical protein
MSKFQGHNLLVAWVRWHFIEVPAFLFSVWKNYLSFGLYFFSVPLLIATLFSPWKRYKWSYPNSFDIGGYVSTFISNIFSRIIGAICRIPIIVAGIIGQIILFFAGLIAIVFWVLTPFIMIGLIFVFYAI